jgi:hypothetical protein
MTKFNGNFITSNLKVIYFLKKGLITYGYDVILKESWFL